MNQLFCCLVTKSCPTVLRPLLQPTRLCCPWDFPGKITGVACHFLQHEIFLTQGLNLSLLHWQTDSLPPSHQCCVFSHIQLFVSPQTVAHQTPLSMEFSRQEDLSGLPFPSQEPPGKPINHQFQLALYSYSALGWTRSSLIPLPH